jgi:hypothetical protein
MSFSAFSGPSLSSAIASFAPSITSTVFESDWRASVM